MTGTDKNSISAALRETTLALYPIAKEEAAQQSRLLLCRVLGYEDASRLILDAYLPFPEDRRAELMSMVARRAAGEPLQYIFGEWDFMGLTFTVRRGALIPRQDTETLCEHALKLIAERKYHTALDMCCGTGCIGLSVAKLSCMDITCADISEACTSLAAENALRLGVSARIIKSDMFSAIDSRYDMILCNPPYIPNGEIPRLQREVRHEPLLALAGGADGLDYYRRLAESYKQHLVEGGALLMEVGAGQAQPVLAMFDNGYSIKDVCGIDRVVVIEG